jgi:hypothetical protein
MGPQGATRPTRPTRGVEHPKIEAKISLSTKFGLFGPKVGRHLGHDKQAYDLLWQGKRYATVPLRGQSLKQECPSNLPEALDFVSFPDPKAANPVTLVPRPKAYIWGLGPLARDPG